MEIPFVKRALGAALFLCAGHERQKIQKNSREGGLSEW